MCQKLKREDSRPSPSYNYFLNNEWSVGKVFGTETKSLFGQSNQHSSKTKHLPFISSVLRSNIYIHRVYSMNDDQVLRCNSRGSCMWVSDYFGSHRFSVSFHNSRDPPAEGELTMAGRKHTQHSTETRALSQPTRQTYIIHTLRINMCKTCMKVRRGARVWNGLRYPVDLWRIALDEPRHGWGKSTASMGE